MRRSTRDTTEAVGSDSFLDVVTNIVGILIILVMVVGMRAGHTPPDSEPQVREAESVDDKTASVAEEASEVQRDVYRLAAHARNVESELKLRELERHQLGVLLVAAEREIADRRAKLNEIDRRRLDRRNQRTAAMSEVAALEQEIARTTSLPGRMLEIRSYDTPVSKTVFGKEIHFQLLGRHIAHIPIDDLLELAKAETRAQMTRPAELAERVMTVGPKQGFEMRYTLEVVPERGGLFAVRAKEWQVIPVQHLLGERIEEAIRDNSNFRRVLSRYNADETTVTLWTYPDSFAEFRALNEELHRLGYATASRPLPKGYPIGGSPHGSKSAAQ